MARSDNSQTEIRVAVDKEFLEALQKRLGVSRATEVARSALTLLDWAATETQNGRVILSSTEKGSDVHRLVMPELSTKKL